MKSIYDRGIAEFHVAPRAVVYSRVSTDGQERDGTSLDTQERACIAHAETQGWRVTERIRDAASGTTLDRVGIERMRELVRARDVDFVVVYSVDRLSRDQHQVGVIANELVQFGVSLKFATEAFDDSATGTLMLYLRVYVAQEEREKILERTSRGKAERARRGRIPQATGKGIFGYRYDSSTGTRSIDKHQAAIVREIFAKFIGGTGCAGIARSLNQREIPAFAGGIWYALTIRRILMNVTYTGHTYYRRTQVTRIRDKSGKKKRQVVIRPESEWIDILGASPLIISNEDFDRATNLLADPARVRRGTPSHRYRLRGRVRCLLCGTPMVGQTLGNGAYSYYRCRNSYDGPKPKRCAARYVRSGLVEAAVLQQITAILAEPDRILEEAMRVDQTEELGFGLDEIEQQEKAVEGRQSRLADLYLHDTIPEALLAEKSAELRKERERLARQRHAIEAARPSSAVDPLSISLRLNEATGFLSTLIAQANDTDFQMIMEALRIEVQASRDYVVVTGEVPLLDSKTIADLVTIEQTSA